MHAGSRVISEVRFWETSPSNEPVFYLDVSREWAIRPDPMR
jgi:hypothetical protein